MRSPLTDRIKPLPLTLTQNGNDVYQVGEWEGRICIIILTIQEVLLYPISYIRLV